MAITDGGPAFPTSIVAGRGQDGEWVSANTAAGMSLRDYFAGQALMGTLVDFGSEVDGRALSVIARRAYNLADAMLKARTTGGS